MSLIACVNPTMALAIDCDEIAITPETRSGKAFAAYVAEHPDPPCIIDPSWRFGFPGHSDPILTPRQVVERFGDEVITNHPRRQWFKTIRRDREGNPVVK